MANDSTRQMDAIINLCKRRGFVFQSSEIYGGFNGFFDYGPLGVELKNNIKQSWWRDMVHRRDDMAGLDTSIIHHPDTWKASGHLDNFTDPLVDCRESRQRFRADQLFFAPVVVDGETIGYVCVVEDDAMQTRAEEQAHDLKRKLARQGTLAPLVLRDFTTANAEQIPLIPSPVTGKPGSLTAPRAFNMMFQTSVGALQDASATAYLRPETAQGIFINFKNVIDTGRYKIPFGIAQIGKAFRNEINPRNFIFRSREFEQMEIEFFISPEADWQTIHKEWIDYVINWFVSIGIPREKLSLYAHPKEKLAHYSKGTTDIMFAFPFGVQELQGTAVRGDFDLTQHGTHSGKSFEYFDESTRKKYIPHVVEPSFGVDRIFLAVLTTAYAEDEVEGEKRILLRLHPRLAPYKAAVFPLVKNKPELLARSEALYKKLKRRWNVFFDASGAIGRRYRRQDEIGTPFAITVDFDTIEKDGTVTVRDRDSLKQIRMSEAETIQFLEEKIEA
ncbi:MAG: glycine--tRNA ligase [Puniceicoccales bacterium]|jgi:glycyl-tRNA synthetase|nr:glycine--tRNA ligase [Puniceicoccales bacterium]